MKKDNIGHNNPPLNLDYFIIKDENRKSTRRIKFTNTFLKKHLIRKYDAVKDVYVDRVINDSKRIGLKVKATTGRSISLFYQYTPKTKRNLAKHHLVNFQR